MERNEHGAALVEYAFLVALIAIAALIGIFFFGHQVDGTYWNIASSLSVG